MKILITGGSGQVGTELQRILKTMHSEIGALPDVFNNAQIDAPSSDVLNLEDPGSIDSWMMTHDDYDLIINSAAVTNVDGCEKDEATALHVNALAVERFAQYAKKQNCKLVHISTDYVFPGNVNKLLTEDDKVCPVSAYGRSKLAGEILAENACDKLFIVRTAWVYGYKGKNFVKTMLRLAKQNGRISVVCDQYGCPTSANDLADRILRLSLTDAYGVYHCTGQNKLSSQDDGGDSHDGMIQSSWYDFACAAVDGMGIECEKEPITTSEYQRRFPLSADRPAYSSLSNDKLNKLLESSMRVWQDALKMYLERLPSLGEE